MKSCNHNGCTFPQFGGGYCLRHQHLRTDGKAPKRIRQFKKINKLSKKSAKENRSYYAEAREFIAANPYCKIQSPACTRFADHPHHPKGRGKNLRNWKIAVPACNACNDYVESHHAWAEARGFKISRHENNNQ